MAEQIVHVRVDLSIQYESEARFFEEMAAHYKRIAAGFEQAADNLRHFSNEAKVAYGGDHSPDRVYDDCTSNFLRSPQGTFTETLADSISSYPAASNGRLRYS
jgi:hypothetical protein